MHKVEEPVSQGTGYPVVRASWRDQAPAAEGLRHGTDSPGRPPPQGRLQRAPLTSATIPHVQRTAGNRAVVQLLAAQREESSVLDVVGRGGGTPLDPTLQAEMSERLGAGFSEVRIHTDSTAADSAEAVQAKAYTVGNEIVFGHGAYSPDTTTGRHTIAHELTHVMQQRSGHVSGTDTGLGFSVSDPSDRFEQAAELNAHESLARPLPAQRTVVQRECECGGSCVNCSGGQVNSDLQKTTSSLIQRKPTEGSTDLLGRFAVVQRDGNTAPGPSGETEAVQPCGLADRLLSFTTWSMASAKLAVNIPALQFAKSSGIVTDNLKTALSRHFGVATTDSAAQQTTVAALLDGYKTIMATILVGIDSVSCGGTECRPNDYAYVYPGAPVRIFFCDTQRSVANLFSDPWDLASTWIHELSHEMIGTRDLEYYNHSSTTSLASAQALGNADCWGNFAIDY
jgi:hypothetical protein